MPAQGGHWVGIDGPGDGDSDGCAGEYRYRSCPRLRHKTALLIHYDFEMECRRQVWGGPAFVYDEEKDLFRWTGGGFAFSREHGG